MFLEPSSTQPARRRRIRGFTLIELIVVVVIIGLTAALATPSVLHQLRENRSRATAVLISELYSGARARAMGRGSAVMVTYAGGAFQIRESIEGAAAVARGQGACATSPGLGCLTTNWTNPANSRLLSSMTPDPLLSLTLTPKFNGASPAQISVCFTPGGRSFYSLDANPPITPLTRTVEFEVQRTNGLLRRTVVLPNGNARLAL